MPAATIGGYINETEQSLGHAVNGAGLTVGPTGGFGVTAANGAYNNLVGQGNAAEARPLMQGDFGASNATYGQANQAYGQSQQDANQQMAANGLLAQAAAGAVPSASAIGGQNALNQGIQAQLMAGAGGGANAVQAQAPGAAQMGQAVQQAGAGRGGEQSAAQAAYYGGTSALTNADIAEQGLSANQAYGQGQLATTNAGNMLTSQNQNDALNRADNTTAMTYAGIGQQDAEAEYNAQVAAQNANTQNNASTGKNVLSGIGSAIGSLFSDARVKEDIQPLDEPGGSASAPESGPASTSEPDKPSLDDFMQQSFTAQPPQDTSQPYISNVGSDPETERRLSAFNAGIDPDQANPWAAQQAAAQPQQYSPMLAEYREAFSKPKEEPWGSGFSKWLSHAIGIGAGNDQDIANAKKAEQQQKAFADKTKPVRYHYDNDYVDPYASLETPVNYLGPNPNAPITSDRAAKKEIHDLENRPMDQFLDDLHPVSFRYKDPSLDPEGSSKQRVGIIAQDALRSPIGSSFITRTPMGLAIDQKAGLSVALAALADLNDRVQAVEHAATKKVR